MAFTQGSTDSLGQLLSTSLYDFDFVKYAQAQGRWISPDPAGMAAADPTNPQSWNRYAYVLNNPLGMVDPLGLCGEPDQWDPNTFTITTHQPCPIGPPPGCGFNQMYGGTIGGVNCGVSINVAQQQGGSGGGSANAVTTQPNVKKGCIGTRVFKGIQGITNVGLGTVKFLGSAGLGILGVAGAPETGGGSLLLDGFAFYGAISSAGQVTSGTAQLYAAVTGNFQATKTAQQIGDINSGPISGYSTFFVTNNAETAATAANVESALTAGAGLASSETFAETAVSGIDSVLSVLGVEDPACH